MRQKRLFLPLLLLAVLFGSCVEEPASPTWTVNYRLPLFNATYTVERLIEESRDANFVIAANGTIDYVITETRERLVDIRDSLRVSLSRTLNVEQNPATVGTPVVRNDSLKIVGGKIERIDTVILKRGVQRLRIENLNASSGTVTVTFPTIRNRANNQPLSLTTPFHGNATTSVQSGNLENFVISSPDRVNIPFVVTTTLTTGDAIDLRITASSDSFVARYAKGVIWNVEENKPAEYDIVVDPIDINAFNSIDTVAGDADPVVTFKLFNFFNVEDTAKPIFRVIMRNGDTLFILEQGRNIVRFVPATPEGATLTQPSVQVALDKNNSNALSFVLSRPNAIYMEGKVLLNPRRLTGSAFDTSTVKLIFELRTPLRFALDTLAASDSSDISEDLNTDNFERLALNLRAESEIPFETEGKISFLDENRRPLRLANGNPFTFPRQGDTTRLRFAAAPIDASTGFSNGVATTTLRLDFTPEELRLLKRAKFAFNQIFANTKTPTPRRVALRSADKVRIRAVGEVQYRFGN
ncbi:MAG: hypothetical protein NZM06_04450 [Chloroherpetonaceae bacterium]|nr:hypothetical protein [Chloroherpetonaceae bacterium]MDW8436754.1 hypothetical protein [Chloroherpetonaceae bacterium]